MTPSSFRISGPHYHLENQKNCEQIDTDRHWPEDSKTKENREPVRQMGRQTDIHYIIRCLCFP